MAFVLTFIRTNIEDKHEYQINKYQSAVNVGRSLTTKRRNYFGSYNLRSAFQMRRGYLKC